ncbi:MAG: S8 family serine peptidase, partial [Planctomycetota bacterium]
MSIEIDGVQQSTRRVGIARPLFESGAVAVVGVAVVGVALACLVAVSQAAPADEWTTPNDPAFQRYPADPHQENLFLLEMEKAWQIEKGSEDVVVAVIDWAFDVDHPDLKNQLWTNAGEVPDNGKDDDQNGFVDDVHGWDFLENDNSLDGENSLHGNHVSGIIAADTNHGVGVAGMAPRCRLMLVKVGLPGVLRDGPIMARAIRYCVDHGARLISKNHGLSEHYPGWHVPVSGELKEACDYAYKKGVLIISGTSSNDGRFYPAGFQGGYESVMGTGASDITGKPSGIYGGSRFCEVIAPGGDRDDGDSHNKRSVYSCYGTSSPLYNYWAGGCMANPHVVGLMALVLSHYKDIDVEQARQIVRNTAKGAPAGFDVRWGHGLVQPVAALSLSADRVASRPELVEPALVEKEDADGQPGYAARVRNTGALDARVVLSLIHEGRKVMDRRATAVGLETTEVHFPKADLPPAGELNVRMENLGMARPRVYDDVLEIELGVTDQDVTVRTGDDGGAVLAVQVHNDGSVDAERVAVIAYEHEPATPVRSGPASRMIDAAVIAVPASGSAEARFDVSRLSGLADL